MRIAVINGPNLNLLGKREPEIYGSTSLDEVNNDLINRFKHVEFTFFQSNIEGEIVNALQQAMRYSDGIILNAGAYTHTSVAIGDTVAAIKIPVIEVHITNIAKRENFRHHSFISAHALGSIIGLGVEGYALAVLWFSETKS
ncbi:MAG: type II 3-dehydroquinate dehydratase [Ferruginibacter sp.]|nr:type II 3-dehydroquinate dehydratase [Ferruginibacter sp.]